MTSSLVQPLFDGPLDIVGDAHGEIDALRSLMQHLGYNEDGIHPEGRRLIFVGDLTDRGPDSPAVVELVQQLVEAGHAQCVLGNHDLNLLLNHPKHENKWFYGEEFLDGDGNVIPQKYADYSRREKLLDFFATLPMALERDDLRVVHACWDDNMLSLARRSSNVVSLYHEHADRIEFDAAKRPEMDDIDRGLLHQNMNPVKKLTSGPEERTEQAVERGGKMRNERRVHWWKDYRDTFCVFGHYSIPDREPRGNGAAFCVDFGVGKRWNERREGKTANYSWKLAALRFPERLVVFDDGERRPCET